MNVSRFELACIPSPAWRLLIVVVLCPLYAACVPLQTVTQSANPAKGVIYFLPKKQIKVTYTRKPGDSNACLESFSLATTPPMPDTEAGGFVATIPVNQVGTNKSYIEVSSRGLLQSAKAETTSDLEEIIGDAISAPVVLPLQITDAVTGCSAVSIVRLIDVPMVVSSSCTSDTICVSTLGTNRHKVYVQNSPANVAAEVVSPSRLVNAPFNVSNALNDDNAGLFYRVELPYTVTILHNVGTTSSQEQPKPTPVLWLPNESPVGFAPVSRSLFGDRKTTLTFSDGSLTKYDTDYSGDVLSIVRLPITIIGAVSTAIGKVATARQANAQAEIDLMDKALTLEKARIRYENCSAALAADDDERVDEYCNK